MKYLFYGDDHVSSRREWQEVIRRGQTENKEVVRLDGQSIDLTDLKQALESQTLFGGAKLVAIENILSRRPSREKDAMTAYLAAFDSDSPDLAVWEQKALTITKLRPFSSRWTIKAFKLPPVLFKFLDAIRPGQTAFLLNLLDQCRQNTAPELVFFMMSRRIRDLIIALDLGKEGLSGAPWQIGKLVNQAKFYKTYQLTDFYQKLLQTDYEVKTGQTPINLEHHLDLLVAGL